MDPLRNKADRGVRRTAIRKGAVRWTRPTPGIGRAQPSRQGLFRRWPVASQIIRRGVRCAGRPQCSREKDLDDLRAQTKYGPRKSRLSAHRFNPENYGPWQQHVSRDLFTHGMHAAEQPRRQHRSPATCGGVRAAKMWKTDPERSPTIEVSAVSALGNWSGYFVPVYLDADEFMSESHPVNTTPISACV